MHFVYLFCKKCSNIEKLAILDFISPWAVQHILPSFSIFKISFSCYIEPIWVSWTSGTWNTSQKSETNLGMMWIISKVRITRCLWHSSGRVFVFEAGTSIKEDIHFFFRNMCLIEMPQNAKFTKSNACTSSTDWQRWFDTDCQKSIVALHFLHSLCTLADEKPAHYFQLRLRRIDVNKSGRPAALKDRKMHKCETSAFYY